MAIIKHEEFKMICDNCFNDISDWSPAKNATHAARQIRLDFKKEFKRGRQFCERCETENQRALSRHSSLDFERFKGAMLNAKLVSMVDIIDDFKGKNK